MIPLRILLACLRGWLETEQRYVIAFPREENRLLEVTLSAGFNRHD